MVAIIILYSVLFSLIGLYVASVKKVMVIMVNSKGRKYVKRVPLKDVLNNKVVKVVLF
ncbi:MAG: hypothetical protein ACRC92_21500 [Peptostreptococcaceae bacterium]